MYGSETSFEQTDDAGRSMIDRVRQAALVEIDGASFPGLESCVTNAVTALSTGTVGGFVPLLAIRHVLCCIRAGSCDCGAC